MSKMSELSQVLDELAACGEGLVKAATAIRDILMAEPDEPSKPAQRREPQAEEPKKYTFTDVRKACAAKSHAGFTEQVRDLIASCGAAKLSDVKEEDYPALMAGLEGIR